MEPASITLIIRDLVVVFSEISSYQYCGWENEGERTKAKNNGYNMASSRPNGGVERMCMDDRDLFVSLSRWRNVAEASAEFELLVTNHYNSRPRHHLAFHHVLIHSTLFWPRKSYASGNAKILETCLNAIGEDLASCRPHTWCIDSDWSPRNYSCPTKTSSVYTHYGDVHNATVIGRNFPCS